MQELKHSPLDAAHRALGAKMVPFGGWEMPLAYDEGTIAEHLACRRGCAIFDVSHLGTLRVHGPDAFDALQRAFTNDLRRIGPGRAQYTHLLDPDDASVVDDIIVWWVDETTFQVMPNASNTARVDAVLSASPADLTAIDTTALRAVVAVQGPTARDVLRRFLPAAEDVERFHVTRLPWGQVPCVVAGTGYTGQDGVEIAVAAEHAPALWHALLAAGARPAGLGARDTLRLEAGLPLHGHELGPGITPLQAGLGWVIGWDKGDFVGREPLAREQAAGPARRLRGLVTEGRRPPRAEQAVLVGDRVVGHVTSGNFSPVLECGIALALVDPALAVGDEVGVDVRGTRVPARIVRLPFVGRS
jgi:aminomethyltransferase